MAQSKELRFQSTTPDAPSEAVVKVYADASGILKGVNTAGTVYPVGQLWTGALTAAQANVVFPAGGGFSGTLTGAAYMLPINGPSGQRLMIPAWRY